jgi:protein SPIRAL1 and related proteins
MQFSSNSFANGANQNCGNVISNRSSTRLHAPPGGRSTAGSLIFGGGAPAPAQGVSSNRFANGSNQNCGNFMTGRSSTRLHAPPGGSSQAGNLIFGGGAADTHQRTTGRRHIAQPTGTAKMPMQPVATNVQSAPIQAMASKQQYEAPPAASAPAAHSTGSRSGGVSANRFANGANQNCGNFLTGRPTSRVLAPPGGKSSGPLW